MDKNLVAALLFCSLCNLFDKSLESCSVPPRRDGVSYFPKKTSYNPGDRIYYRCNTGCRPVAGPSSQLCGVTYGQTYGWSPSNIPRCQCYGNPPIYPPTTSRQYYRTTTSRYYHSTTTTPQSYFCDRPSRPAHGSVRSSSGLKYRYSVGEQVTFSCDYGYQLQGKAVASCDHHGWSHQPTCDVIHVCRRPLPLEYGSIVDSYQSSQSSYRVGDWVTYSCNVGYCLNGNGTVYCRSSGWSHTPSCSKSCQHRNAPSYGSYVGSQTNWCPGQRARFQCNRSFRMYGEEYSKCQYDGSWDYAVPTCRKICSRPSIPQYGRIVSRNPNKQEYSERESVRFACNDGYCMTGEDTIYCRHNGWTAGPTCKRKCRHRNAPSYGSYVGSQTSWCPGQRAQYRCNPTFRMVGEEYSRCLDDGSWDHDVPVCSKICSRPSIPQYGRIVSRNPNKREYSERESVRFACNDDYCLAGDDTIYCRHSGWTAGPTCRGKCRHRSAPSYGSYVGSKTSWCPGQRAQYRCNPTFRMIGEEYSTCQYDGSWDHDVPVCKKICSRPNIPEYGRITSERPNRREYFENETVTFACNYGYCMSGSSSIKCSHRGWADGPICRRKCRHRSAPSYGSYVGTERNWCPGQRAQYRCNSTFRMVGEEYSTCQYDGSWDHDVPICEKICYRPSNPSYGFIETSGGDIGAYTQGNYITYQCRPGYCLVGNPRVTCNHDGWSHRPTCSKGCILRSGPSYGGIYGIKRSWCPGEKARFFCNTKLKLYGSENITCQADGTWDSSVPTCHTCRRPLNPSYGNVVGSKTEYDVGEFVTYRCNNGYCLSGSSQVYCRNHGWTDTPQCRRGCRSPSPPDYGFIANRQTWYCPGDTITYACRDGTHMIGQSFSTCLTTQVWNSQKPTCIHQPQTYPPSYDNHQQGDSCRGKCGRASTSGPRPCSCKRGCPYTKIKCCNDYQALCARSYPPVYGGNPRY